MKQLLVGIITILILGLVAGCGGKTPDTRPDGEVMLPPVLEDPVLLEFNELINKWEVSQTYGKPEEEEQLKQLEDRAKVQYTYLLKKLSSPNPRERQVAAAAVGFSRNASAVPALLRLLEDSDPDVVGNAMLGIGMIGDTKMDIQPLLPYLGHPNPDLRSKTTFVLSRVLAKWDSRGALNPLILSLSDSDDRVRINALNALGMVGDSRAVVPITQLCLGDRNGMVRYAAVVALGEIGYMGKSVDFPDLTPPVVADSPVGKLIETLQDENVRIKEAAHWSLRKITHEELDLNHDHWVEWYTHYQLDELLDYSQELRRKEREEQEQKQRERYEKERRSGD